MDLAVGSRALSPESPTPATGLWLCEVVRGRERQRVDLVDESTASIPAGNQGRRNRSPLQRLKLAASGKDDCRHRPPENPSNFENVHEKGTCLAGCVGGRRRLVCAVGCVQILVFHHL